jgi:addiction module RelE/StbE family toxin
MPRGGERRRTVRPVQGFKQAYKLYLKQDSSIADRMHEFNVNKRKVPPVALPSGMRDHKLKGTNIWECHLASNILLLYRYEGNIVRLIKICTHDDLKKLGRKKRR